MTRRTAPSTMNAEAKALIRAAEAKCNGCCVSWRLRPRGLTYFHRGGVRCSAPVERFLLRMIAFDKRKPRPVKSRITIEFGCVEYGLPQWPSRSTWRIPQ